MGIALAIIGTITICAILGHAADRRENAELELRNALDEWNTEYLGETVWPDDPPLTYLHRRRNPQARLLAANYQTFDPFVLTIEARRDFHHAYAKGAVNKAARDALNQDTPA